VWACCLVNIILNRRGNGETFKKEGIAVKDDTIVNFKEKFWDPAEEFL
jgi:hypothetical protein